MFLALYSRSANKGQRKKGIELWLSVWCLYYPFLLWKDKNVFPEGRPFKKDWKGGIF